MPCETDEVETTTCPAPGVYEGVPFEEYLLWDALNQSGAKRLLRSPAHFMAEPDDESESKSRGTICHAGLWEPETFEKLYAMGPDVDLRTKAGKEEWSAFCGANAGKYPVRGKDVAAMCGVRRSVWNHRNARRLLAAEGPCELSIVWRDNEIDVMCKARIDKHAAAIKSVVDLKTTTDARPRKFRNTIGELSYHLQGAFNLHGMAAVGLTCERFYLIAAETKDPFAVMVYELDDKAIERGRALMLEACAEYAHCKSTGIWPCYDEAPLKITHPERA
jgi:hypothetical protein